MDGKRGRVRDPDYYEGDDFNDVVSPFPPRCCGLIPHTRAEALQGSCYVHALLLFPCAVQASYRLEYKYKARLGHEDSHKWP